MQRGQEIHFHLCGAGDERFLSQGETLVQYFEHEFKQQTMELCHNTSLGKEKYKSVLSAGKIMANLFGWIRC